MRASLVAQTVKRLSARQETRVRSLGREDPLEKEMATHSNILAWKIPWTEEPGRPQSVGSQRVGHNWATLLSLSTNVLTEWTGTSIQGRTPLSFSLWGNRVSCHSLWVFMVLLSSHHSHSHDTKWLSSLQLCHLSASASPVSISQSPNFWKREVGATWLRGSTPSLQLWPGTTEVHSYWKGVFRKGEHGLADHTQNYVLPLGQGSGLGNPQASGSPVLSLGSQLHFVKKIPTQDMKYI